jgi:hypothetical protein
MNGATTAAATEEWVAVEGFPGYSVNRRGQVRKDSTGRVLHVRLNQFGVPYVGLMRDGQRHQSVRSLPRLVAKAFIPQTHDAFDIPINLNGDRTDCRVENLMWRPRWYAVYYNNQFADRYDNPINAPIRDADSDDEYPNSLAAACANGLLEREVVLSILNLTPAWPTYQFFVLVD